MKRWPLNVIAGVAALIIVVRAIWGDALFFDHTSVVLFSIGAASLLLCYLPLKRIKVGDVEVELELNRLGKAVQKAQSEILGGGTSYTLPRNVPGEIKELIKGASEKPEGTLLEICAALERKLRERLGDEVGYQLSLEDAINKGVANDLFPAAALEAFRRFWEATQYIAVDKHFRVEPSAVFTLIAAGIDLFKLISSEPHESKRRAPFDEIAAETSTLSG